MYYHHEYPPIYDAPRPQWRYGRRTDPQTAIDILEYLEDGRGYVRYHPEDKATTQALYQGYQEWCDDDAAEPVPPKAFCDFLSASEQKLGLKKTCNIYASDGSRHRGYLGIAVLSGEEGAEGNV